MPFLVKNQTDRKIAVNLSSGNSIRLPAKTSGEGVTILDEERDSPELVAMERAFPRPIVAVTKIVEEAAPAEASDESLPTMVEEKQAPEEAIPAESTKRNSRGKEK